MASPARLETSVEKIHSTAMAILAKVGIKVHDPEICDHLRKNGVKVDRDIVYFTEDQVLAWVRKAPEQFTLHARNPVFDAVIGAGQPQYAAGYGCAEIIAASDTGRSLS